MKRHNIKVVNISLSDFAKVDLILDKGEPIQFEFDLLIPREEIVGKLLSTLKQRDVNELDHEN